MLASHSQSDSLTGLEGGNGRHSATIAELLEVDGKRFEMKILGDCMQPDLLSGDRVRVVPGTRYLPGDIVVYRDSGNRLVAHRLLGTTLTGKGWRYMIKADNAARIDGVFERNRVLGRLTRNVTRQSDICVSASRRMNCLTRLLRQSLVLAGRKMLG